MSISLKHTKTSTIPDAGDSSLVQPSDWNSEHAITCATNKVLGRVTAGSGAVEEIDFTDLVTLSGAQTKITATGILKGVGGGSIFSAAAGTDYVAPSVLGAANGVATLGSDSKLTASQIPDIAVVDYLGSVASELAMLALTGQKGDWCTRSDLGTNWIITGSNPAVIGSWTQLSYPTAPVTSVNGQTGAVSLSAANVGAQPTVTVNGIVKGNGSGILSAAVSGTDYAPATIGSSILAADGSGGFSSVTVGSGLSYTGGTLSSTSGGGSVTSVSVTSANGFAGTVANATTTPAISLSTTVTGLLKGNGTAISAATSGTDYAPATSGSAILKGNGAGGFSSAIAGTDYQAPITTPSGAIVGTTDTQTLTNKRITPRILASTANSATPTLNSDNYDMMVITGQSVAITSFTTNLTGTPTNGQKLWISITGTTAIGITWGASFESSTVTLPTTTVTTARLDVGFVWNVATSKWRCVASA